MYHFIRRFFFFVFVFACCFSYMRSGILRADGIVGTAGYSPSLPFDDFVASAASYGKGYFSSGATTPYRMGFFGMMYIDGTDVVGSTSPTLFDWSGSVAPSVPAYSSPTAQSLYQGSPTWLIAPNDTALVTNLQHIPSVASQPYVPGVGTGGKSFSPYEYAFTGYMYAPRYYEQSYGRSMTPASHLLISNFFPRHERAYYGGLGYGTLNYGGYYGMYY